MVAICLIFVTIQKIPMFLIGPIKKLLVKWKKCLKEKQLHSMKTIDGKESNTAKGVNAETGFNEFKETFFNKKIIRHKT